MNPNNPSLLQALSLKNKEHINRINNVSKDLLLYGRYVKDKAQTRASSTSEVNGILQNKTNMSRDIKGKLYSFYSDFVSTNKNLDNPKGININRMIALGCKKNSNLSNQNYDDIKKRENVEKTKHEIFGILSTGPLTKRFTKSSSCVDLFSSNNKNINTNINDKNSIKSAYKNNFSNGIRSELTKMLNGRVSCNTKPKNLSVINNTGTLQKDNNRNITKKFQQSDDDLQMKNDFESLGDKCDKLQTKLKLFSL